MLDRNWDAMRRALLILRALRQEPADKQGLIKAVQADMPPAYREPTQKAQGRTFERDLENVRYRLLATVTWESRFRHYVLHEPGPFGHVPLPDEALSGFAFLMDSLTTSEEIQGVIRPLLNWVEQSIPSEQLRKMTHQQAPIQLNIQHISEGNIEPAVWEKVIYAIKQRRIIQFDYTSPIHEKPEPRRHTVEPYEHYFRGGHFYLKAYCLRWVAPNGFEAGHFWANPYRLDYILPTDFQLLKRFVLRERRRPTQVIRYKLSPQIARGGISRYFYEMEIGPVDENGWVEVQARSDNLFEAYRTLLAYGNQCVALDPPELVNRFRMVVADMARFYGE